MSGQVSNILKPVAGAISDLDLPVDNAVLTEAFALADRLNAKLAAAVGEHDAAELWRNDGATSMTAWLRHHTRKSGRDASACATTARRLRALPVTASAYRWFLDHQQHRRGGRRRPHLNIVATLHDLERRGQGRLLDGSILDGTTVQRLFCDAGAHRVFVAGRSSILDYGTTTRTVPANLFNALAIRYRHCRFPGCDRPPEWCEAHHVRWLLDGGPTALDNLTLQCSRHHHLLHSPGWHAKLLPDNTLEITDPKRQVHTSDPPALQPPLPLRE
jgi:hypothetical protein